MIGDIIFPPCTPYGVQYLLEYQGIRVERQNVVVVGASNIVGKPMAMMLLRNDPGGRAVRCAFEPNRNTAGELTIILR